MPMRDMFSPELVVPMEGLSEDEMEKLWFVETYVQPLVAKATRGHVFACDYLKSVTGSECVRMRTGMANDYREFRANVTGDSLWALVRDTMRAVDRANM